MQKLNSFDCQMTKLEKEQAIQTMERSDLAKSTHAEHLDDVKMLPINHRLSHSWLTKSMTLRFSFRVIIGSFCTAVAQGCLSDCSCRCWRRL